MLPSPEEVAVLRSLPEAAQQALTRVEHPGWIVHPTDELDLVLHPAFPYISGPPPLFLPVSATDILAVTANRLRETDRAGTTSVSEKMRVLKSERWLAWAWWSGGGEPDIMEFGETSRLATLRLLAQVWVPVSHG